MHVMHGLMHCFTDDNDARCYHIADSVDDDDDRSEWGGGEYY